VCRGHRPERPRDVVVATELAKVGGPEDSLSGTPPMRAFQGTVREYELIYERLMRTPPGDPCRELRLDVIEAIFDHQLYRETAGRIHAGVVDRPATNPASHPMVDYGYVRNPFEEADDLAAEADRRQRKEFQRSAVSQFVVRPMIVVGAVAAAILFSLAVPDEFQRIRLCLVLACLLIAGGVILQFFFSFDNV